MEKDHHEGDLAAVVRASGLSAAYKWQTHHSLISEERASRTLITDLDTANNPSDPPPTLIAHSKSTEPHVVLPNLSRNKSACMATGPVEMQAEIVVNPYYNGNLLSRYGSASASLCSSLFEIPEKYSTGPSLRFLSTAAAAPMSSDAEKTNPRKLEGMNQYPSKNEGMNHGLACGTAASSEISRIPKVVAEISKKDQTNSLNSPSRKVAQGSSASSSSLVAPKVASTNSKCEAAKRRKTQQKRVVCVPAAVGSNKPSGEDVPSDHWAWRKYGQKPIKGSPYPRGYYRCSSSKGCLARKQVERDRTDPSMVIMTYTSDHNHPWPTHRSSLAGSIRQTRSLKSEELDQCPNQEVVGSKPNDNIDMHNTPQNGNFASIMEPSKAATTEDAGPTFNEERLFNIHDEDVSGLHISVSALIYNNDDFFADLPEPMNMQFARQPVDDQSLYDDDPDSTVVDPFNLFNWSTTTNISTFGEDKTTM